MTAYVDFLTYPIATFGVPAIIGVVLSRDNHLEEKLVEIVRNGLLWCLGYGMVALLIGVFTFKKLQKNFILNI